VATLFELPFHLAKDFNVTLQNLTSIGMDALHHRVAITAEAGEKTSETVSQKIFDELPVP
jgi:hypothetical protein